MPDEFLLSFHAEENEKESKFQKHFPSEKPSKLFIDFFSEPAHKQFSVLIENMPGKSLPFITIENIINFSLNERREKCREHLKC